MIGLLLICLLPGKYASCQEDMPEDESFLQSTWEWVKGSRPKNALLLGMWSLHLDGTGVIGNGRSNEQNHLLGFQAVGSVPARSSTAIMTVPILPVFPERFIRKTSVKTHAWISAIK
jgi:hypothetical protein